MTKVSGVGRGVGGGRKPLPAAIHILRGNPSSRPLREEPEPRELASLDPPPWLDEDAAAVWRDWAPRAHGMKVLTDADVPAFAMVCEIEAEIRQIKALIRKHGLMVVTGHTDADEPPPAKKRGAKAPAKPKRRAYKAIKAHPLELSLEKRRAMLWIAWAKFGMTPSDRTRLGVTKPGGEIVDPADEFLPGGRVPN